MIARVTCDWLSMSMAIVVEQTLSFLCNTSYTQRVIITQDFNFFFYLFIIILLHIYMELFVELSDVFPVVVTKGVPSTINKSSTKWHNKFKLNNAPSKKYILICKTVIIKVWHFVYYVQIEHRWSQHRHRQKKSGDTWYFSVTRYVLILKRVYYYI